LIDVIYNRRLNPFADLVCADRIGPNAPVTVFG
jgi:hypothetical protein